MGSLAGIDLPADAMRGPGKPNESRFIRCYQCGFPVDTERDLTSSERDGVSLESATLTATGQDNVTVTQPVVRHGCPFCGADRSAWGPGGSC